MKDDSDLLEIALIKNIIRTTTKLNDQQQLCCYFNDKRGNPYYALLLTPFCERYIFYRLDKNLTLKLHGNLSEINQFPDQFFSLINGKQVFQKMLNIKKAYIQIKTEYYQD